LIANIIYSEHNIHTPKGELLSSKVVQAWKPRHENEKRNADSASEGAQASHRESEKASQRCVYAETSNLGVNDEAKKKKTLLEIR